ISHLTSSFTTISRKRINHALLTFNDTGVARTGCEYCISAEGARYPTAGCGLCNFDGFDHDAWRSASPPRWQAARERHLSATARVARRVAQARQGHRRYDARQSESLRRPPGLTRSLQG